MEFKDKLQELRKQKGLTQEELAEILYVSRTAVSKWESGRGYPNIDSLKTIAKFFSITVDELLSSEQVLSIAQEDSRRRKKQARDLVFGLLDISMILLLFLPFFGQKSEEGVQSVALIFFDSAQLYIKIAFYVAIILTAVLGVARLAFQNLKSALWQKINTPLSLALGVVGVLLFIITSQVYATVFAFVLLAVKAFLLIKK